MLGWRLRTSRPGFALSIQGGAVGILYSTVFAAFHLYALIPPVAAFALLTSIAALSALLAVKQNSQSLALLGVTGGFPGSILASSGNGDHVFLFGYYALLNAGILLVSWFKSWRGSISRALPYVRHRHHLGSPYLPRSGFSTTEPFLILFFLFYVGIAVFSPGVTAAAARLYRRHLGLRHAFRDVRPAGLPAARPPVRARL